MAGEREKWCRVQIKSYLFVPGTAFFVANLYMRWLICTYVFYSFFIMLELILSKNDSIITKKERDVNENDAKESKKPDLCRIGIDPVRVAVRWNRHDSAGGRYGNGWVYICRK